MSPRMLVAKAAKVATYVVLPGAMIASILYTPSDYGLPKKPKPQ